MGYSEHDCVACKTKHDAALWYYRDRDGRREYLCGAEHAGRPDKATWLLEPDAPIRPA